MQVNLLQYNPDALELLLYTKGTRLGGGTLEDIKAMPMEDKLSELAYMRDTIQSSWEFSSYVFEIKDVTRAFTHQLVRTRTASYQQEAQRVVDLKDKGWLTPTLPDADPDTEESCIESFNLSVEDSINTYDMLVQEGMPRQDARGVIPTNIYTNIIMGANLRTLSHMAELRLCTRAQGEYQAVFREMRQRVIEVHPWAEDFLQVYCAKTGLCFFPRYTECPIQRHTYNAPDAITMHDALKDIIKDTWEETKHEANPIVKDGRTM